MQNILEIITGSVELQENNYQCERGDDFVLDLVFKDADGVVVDITGWVVFMTLKLRKWDSDTNSAIRKDVSEHTDPTHGETQISISNADTKNLLGSYFYDIQYKDDDDIIKTVMRGQIIFTRDITVRTEPLE